MQKVKLVFYKSFTDEPTGLFSNGFSADVEVELPAGFNSVHLTGARVYDDRKASETPGGDTNAIVLSYQDIRTLEGKLLTYIDATYSDQEQRKAHKDLVRQALWDWNEVLAQRAVQVVDAYTESNNVGSVN